MVFSTIIFLCVYLPLTILLYYLMPQKGRNYFLLFASLMFYAWGEPKFVLVMLASIVCNYIFGLLLSDVGKGQGPGRRRVILALAVMVNLGILFVFKYLTFAMQNLQKLIPSMPVWQIALPIGISFYTFQGLSYVIDVYRDADLVQKNPCSLALYISMFPQLIAGPIVRYRDVRQALDARSHTAERFAQGAGRFIVGLSKKAILANMMGELAQSIQTGDFSVMSAQVAWLGAVAYTLQIYFDFSGYSDMAIGLGRIFGFDFQENFNAPYISTSIREFWRRWHISLSAWFRDYLYIPLGGNRRGNVYLHLLIVFMATGIWHGAAWGFLLWGLWHGMFSLLERFVAQRRQAHSDTQQEKTGALTVRNVLGWIYTMLVVAIGWVLFSLVDLKTAASYLAVMLGANAGGFHAYDLRFYLSNQMLFYLTAALLACVPWRAVLKRHALGVYNRLYEEPPLFVMIVQKLTLLFLLVLCFIFIINSSYNPFIYFRF